MKPDSAKDRKTSRPFWLDLVILLAAASLVGILFILFDISSLSNGYFLAGAVYILISAVPIFTEIGGNARTGYQARRQGKNPMEAIRDEETTGRYSRGTRITFLYGLSGFICFVLALLAT